MKEKVVKPMFQGEVQFAGYADGSRGGPRVTFRLADRDDLGKFIGMEGKRFMAVLVEIADDEAPAEPEKPAAPRTYGESYVDLQNPGRHPDDVRREVQQRERQQRRERMAPLCEWAVYRCAEPQFQQWIRRQYDLAMGGDGTGWGDVSPATDFKNKVDDYAAHCIKVLCQVDSRKEFDTDKAAGERFKTLVMGRYAEWLKLRSRDLEAT